LRKRKATAQASKPQSLTRLRKAISSRTKAELVEVVLELAQADRQILRQVTARFDMTPAELVAATYQAIIDATAFDERQINHNFDYNWAAYEEVKRNLGRLVGAGKLKPAMELSLELMKRGSYQVEMSDEGLMMEEIEDCLSMVLDALRKCDLAPHKIIAWCSAMLTSDRVKFIAEEDLQSLRSNARSAAAEQHERQSR
jgi:hypothetical protein